MAEDLHQPRWPLSPTQVGFLALQDDTESSAFNIGALVRLLGPLELRRLRDAVDAVVARHPVLGSTVRQVGHDVVQDAAHPSVRILDVVDEPASPDAIDAAAERLMAQPFDLWNEPPFRAQVFRQAPDRHALVLVVHHIAWDETSTGVFLSELSSAYGTRATGAITVSTNAFARYARDAAELASSTAGRRMVGQAVEELRGLSWGSTLPYDRPPRRSSLQRSGRRLVAPMQARLSHDVIAEARRRRTTVSALGLAAAASALAQWSGHLDFAIGVPISDRVCDDFQGAIGNFVRLAPLRFRLHETSTLNDVCSQAKAALLAAMDNRAPYPLIYRELLRRSGGGVLPELEMSYSYFRPRHNEVALDGTLAQVTGLRTPASRFPVSVDLYTNALGNLEIAVDYDSDAFHMASVAYLAKTIVHSLGDIVDDAHHAGYLTTRQMKVEPFGSRLDSRAETNPLGVVESFLAAAEERPDSIAVSDSDSHVTYQELRDWTASIASNLRLHGAGPEHVVAILGERSSQLVAGIIGVLRAGAAYLVIEPQTPAERASLMLADTGCQVVLTDAPESVLLAGFNGTILPLAPLRSPAVSFVDEVADPETAAYVIYTSGSTGQPKGVVVSRAAMAALFADCRSWLRPSARDTWSLFHSASFDFSVWEIWGALAFGGRLVVVPQDTARSPERFLSLLAHERVTVLSQTPTAFASLDWADEAAGAADPLALRAVIFGGESLQAASVSNWSRRRHNDPTQFINMYGITEVTVHATRVTLPRDALTTVPSIGQALSHARIRVLDKALRPVPPGEIGEICVAGLGVARGYLGRPALTAERFVPDPGGPPGSRMYRSGDLGRYDPKADLLYYEGRSDTQIKLHGYRIELREITATLEQHDGVNRAFATLDAPNARLVAYVLPQPGATLTSSLLREYLGSRLPAYMVPAQMHLVSSLPLTTNGKIDISRLDACALANVPSGPAARHSAIAAQLLRIWTQVLDVPPIRLGDNFFALGGDSLRALQVVIAARRAGFRVTVADVLECQTVAELTRRVELCGPSPERLSAPFALVTEDDMDRLPPDAEDAYPLTSLQTGMLYHLRQAAGVGSYHNVNSWRLSARFSAAAFRRAVEELVRRHPVLRTSFDLTSYSVPLQVVHRTAAVECLTDDLRHVAATKAEKVIDHFIVAERHRAFELRRPGLIRFALHILADDLAQLTVTDCHPILDGWSFTSSVADLLLLHDQFSAGTCPAHVTPSPTAFSDYVRLERQAERDARQRDFWAGALRDADATDLSHMRIRAARSRHPEASHLVRSVSVPRSAQKKLFELSHARGVALKSILLACHLKVLSLLTGAPHPISGLILNGRPEEPGADTVRGLFLNTLPLRADLSGTTWFDLVRQAHAAEMAVFPNRRYPFASLKSLVGPAADVQVAFNFVHFHSLRETMLADRTRGWRRHAAVSEFTNFPALVHCAVAPDGHDITVTLTHNTTDVSRRFAAIWTRLLGAALRELVDTPDAEHHGWRGGADANSTGQLCVSAQALLDAEIVPPQAADGSSPTQWPCLIMDEAGVPCLEGVPGTVRIIRGSSAAPLVRASPHGEPSVLGAEVRAIWRGSHVQIMPPASAKVHRARIRRSQPEAPTAASRAPVPEAALRGIWGEVLGRTDIEPDSDFFALGGDSLSALRLVALVEDRYGVALSLERLFESPRLASQAKEWWALQPEPAALLGVGNGRE